MGRPKGKEYQRATKTLCRLRDENASQDEIDAAQRRVDSIKAKQPAPSPAAPPAPSPAPSPAPEMNDEEQEQFLSTFYKQYNEVDSAIKFEAFFLTTFEHWQAGTAEHSGETDSDQHSYDQVAPTPRQNVTPEPPTSLTGRHEESEPATESGEDDSDEHSYSQVGSKPEQNMTPEPPISPTGKHQESGPATESDEDSFDQPLNDQVESKPRPNVTPEQLSSPNGRCESEAAEQGSKEVQVLQLSAENIAAKPQMYTKIVTNEPILAPAEAAAPEESKGAFDFWQPSEYGSDLDAFSPPGSPNQEDAPPAAVDVAMLDAAMVSFRKWSSEAVLEIAESHNPSLRAMKEHVFQSEQRFQDSNQVKGSGIKISPVPSSGMCKILAQ